MFMSEDNKDLLLEINKTLKTLVSQFYYRPHIFFKESEFQHYFYSVFYKNLGAQLFTTKDGKQVNLVHPEYEGARKIPGKWRPCYDMVILNPKFIERNLYERVTSKDISKINDIEKDDLLAIFELKFIPKNTTAFVKQLEKDYVSISNAREGLHRYMVVFSLVQDDKDVLEFLSKKEWDERVHLVYTKVSFDKKNKKRVEVLIKPDNFLNLPSKWLKK